MAVQSVVKSTRRVVSMISLYEAQLLGISRVYRRKETVGPGASGVKSCNGRLPLNMNFCTLLLSISKRFP
jgi:hypothetical protein